MLIWKERRSDLGAPGLCPLGPWDFFPHWIFPGGLLGVEGVGSLSNTFEMIRAHFEYCVGMSFVA